MAGRLLGQFAGSTVFLRTAAGLLFAAFIFDFFVFVV